MTNSMLELFSNAGVTSATLARLERAMRRRDFDTGDYLLRQGESAPALFFIRHGMAKMYYLTVEGREFVKSFVKEGDFAGSLMAQMEGGGSPFSVVCLEPVSAESIPFDVLREVFHTDPAAMAFGLKFFQALALKKERREHSFLCLAPKERYRAFVDEDPDLARRITQADIARYLGITPVALSRIRGRLKASWSA